MQGFQSKAVGRDVLPACLIPEEMLRVVRKPPGIKRKVDSFDRFHPSGRNLQVFLIMLESVLPFSPDLAKKVSEYCERHSEGCVQS